MVTSDDCLIAWHTALYAHAVRVDSFIWHQGRSIPFIVMGTVKGQTFSLVRHPVDLVLYVSRPCLPPLSDNDAVRCFNEVPGDVERRDPMLVIAEVIAKLRNHACPICTLAAEASL